MPIAMRIATLARPCNWQAAQGRHAAWKEKGGLFRGRP